MLKETSYMLMLISIINLLKYHLSYAQPGLGGPIHHLYMVINTITYIASSPLLSQPVKP